jgi:Icc-related predicted phosphoesterase
MRIVCIADTHELHREVELPAGDMLIHAGDFTLMGKRRSQIRDFNKWLGEQPHRYKIVIPGNHEFVLEEPQERQTVTNATLLVDSGIEIEGLRIWGSPVTPLYGGAFAILKAEDRKRHWSRVPQRTDILITHGPPLGILDQPAGTEHQDGCPELLEAVLRVKPRLHVFGHVHGVHGMTARNDTIFVNAALFQEAGRLDTPPILLDLNRR